MKDGWLLQSPWVGGYLLLASNKTRVARWPNIRGICEKFAHMKVSSYGWWQEFCTPHHAMMASCWVGLVIARTRQLA